MTQRKTIPATAAALVLLGLGGCADLSPTAQRTGTGALAGSAGGALIGAMAGNAGMGALIGAGVGAAGGYLFDQHKQAEQRAYVQGVQAGRASATR